MRAVYLLSVLFHVIAAMTWVGGMVIFVAAVMPVLRHSKVEGLRGMFLPEFGRRFSQLSWTCFAILVPTGAINLWMRGVRPGDFIRPEWRETAFGQVVVIKLTLVALAVLLSLLHQQSAARPHTRWLGRSLLVVGVAIVMAAVMLVRSP